ncbi:MAG TPA: hydantoinase B/oxoprolinase family protein [Solirubrobacteraceae bacterium]|jgi:N-methylhydantoinase B/oxoprolinase/acetone carboxylase alpha subunit|nr:hydantoinase B/oxoprolinase family protein [Solirubrobacteraceae bacterium]
MSHKVSIDPVTLTVIDNYLTSTCRDMGVTMMTTAYSPIFNESLDFSCVIFNPRGEMLAQAEFCPSQIGTIKFTVEWTIAELGADAFDEGDVVIHNDPYRGSGHVPEHMLLAPVFWEGQLVAFVANVAHMSEVGAKTPGGLSGDATEVFQEGLLIPPVRIKRRGEDVPDIWNMILSNHRTPRVTYGDFRAMMGSLDMAQHRLHKLIEQHGLELFQDAGDELIAIAERRMRAEIEQIPDGVYTFEDVIEDDGIGTDSYPMKLRLMIDGGEVVADFTGSASQAVGPVNAIYAVTASAIYNAFLHLTDRTIPRNEGCYRPFTIIAPRGTIVNCDFPAPVAGGNTETSPRITDMVFGALAQAIPDRVVASCGGTSSPFLFGGRDPRTGGLYAHFHFEGVGWGGRPDADGNNMVVTINGNCRNTPVEVFETRYPAFRIESYRLAADSGGPGRFRGGLGGERIFTVTVPEVTVSALLNRMHTSPWGTLGGGEGAVGGLWVRRSGQPEWRTFVEEFGTMSPSKFSGVTLRDGDQVRIVMPGGGGYGDPRERDPARVRRDIEEGFISPEGAVTDYGYDEAED